MRLSLWFSNTVCTLLMFLVIFFFFCPISFCVLLTYNLHHHLLAKKNFTHSGEQVWQRCQNCQDFPSCFTKKYTVITSDLSKKPLKKYYKDSEALDSLLRDEVFLPLLRKRSKNASVLFKENGLLSIRGHFQSTGIPVCSMF